MMETRKALQKHSGVVSGAAILITIGAIIFLLRSQTRIVDKPNPTKEFFTTDDGKTWFIDDITKLPPWKTPDGKTACTARVYRCGNGEPFVGHLEKYDERVAAKTQTRMFGFTRMAKRPGDAKWVVLSDKTADEYTEIMSPPKCPNGKPAEPVLPE